MTAIRSVGTIKLPGTTDQFLRGDGVFATPSAGAGGNITYGTRAALPAVPVAGSVYICTDSPYRYLSDGVNWNAYLFGQPVTEPSGLTKINSGPTTTLDQTFGGYLFYAAGGTDQVVSYVKAVTPSSTLRVAFGYQQQANAQVGCVIYNSNTNRIYIYRSILGTAYNYFPHVSLYTSDGAVFNSTNSVFGAISRKLWPDGIIIFRFDSTNFYIDTCTDYQGNGLIDNLYSEALSANIGSNFTHVGFGVNLNGNSGGTIWGQHLQILTP